MENSKGRIAILIAAVLLSGGSKNRSRERVADPTKPTSRHRIQHIQHKSQGLKGRDGNDIWVGKKHLWIVCDGFDILTVDSCLLFLLPEFWKFTFWTVSVSLIALRLLWAEDKTRTNAALLRAAFAYFKLQTMYVNIQDYIYYSTFFIFFDVWFIHAPVYLCYLVEQKYHT